MGASVDGVREVAVGAGFARGEAAGQVATIAKLSRVILLAPLIFALGAYARARGQGAGGAAPVPLVWPLPDPQNILAPIL